MNTKITISKAHNEQINTILETIKSCYSPILKVSENFIEDFNSSIQLSLKPIYEQLENTKNIITKQISKEYSSAINKVLENFNKSINDKLISFTFDCNILDSTINFISSVASDVPDLKNEIDFIKNQEKNKLNYYDAIILIATVLTLIFTILSYFKTNPYEKEILKSLQDINSNLEQIIESEATESKPIKQFL